MRVLATVRRISRDPNALLDHAFQLNVSPRWVGPHSRQHAVPVRLRHPRGAFEGALRYLVFYFICGLGANLVEILASLGSNLPGLGASGAISGVLAGYLVLYPGSRIKALVPLAFLYWSARVPAWVFIGLWFVYQFIEGLLTVGSVGGGVAYSAHVGGFVTGLVLVRVFAHTQRVDYMRAYHGF